MSSVSTDLFLTRLEKSNLLSRQQFAALRSEIEGVVTAVRSEALARRLVKVGLLTEWQTQMLMAGQYAFYLGKYKLLDSLGHGGMGVVFKAENATLGRIVAIKVLEQRQVKNPALVARFHREIQAAAALNNPHVVVAYDADSVRETHFLVMEYVNGSDLGTLLDRRKRLHVEEACEFIRQAAVGLQHAHERGMVHRDLKPSNLILTFEPNGQPLIKILDMGLARFVHDEAEEQRITADVGSTRRDGLTQIGQIMGTPDYMSPEQAWNTKAVDIRSDIFSLGCTLFQLVTGRLPYRGQTPTEKVVARANSDAPPVSSVLEETPPGLDAVVAKMLARDPSQRYQTPAEVALALESFCVLPEEMLTQAPATDAFAEAADTDANIRVPEDGEWSVVSGEWSNGQSSSEASLTSPHSPLTTHQSPPTNPRWEQFLGALATEAVPETSLPHDSDRLARWTAIGDELPRSSKRRRKRSLWGLRRGTKRRRLTGRTRRKRKELQVLWWMLGAVLVAGAILVGYVNL